jgi:hypothetical protein
MKINHDISDILVFDKKNNGITRLDNLFSIETEKKRKSDYLVN